MSPFRRSDFDAWLELLISSLKTADRPLADEIEAVRRARSVAPGAAASRGTSGSRAARPSLQQTLRNIVLRVGRPVLAVVRGVPQLEFTDAHSEVWRSRLQAAGDHLQRAAGAVGRIDVIGLPGVPYAGTGWLVE